MDFLWFLRRRLGFVSDLYDTATAPFAETMRKIEAGEEPYLDLRNPEDVSEPAFLDEGLAASDSVDVIGYWCLCTVHASFKAYLEEYVADMSRSYCSSPDDLRTMLTLPVGNISAPV